MIIFSMSKIIRTKLGCSTINTVFILLFLWQRDDFYYFFEETISSHLKKICDSNIGFLEKSSSCETVRKFCPNNNWFVERILRIEKCKFLDKKKVNFKEYLLLGGRFELLTNVVQTEYCKELLPTLLSALAKGWNALHSMKKVSMNILSLHFHATQKTVYTTLQR